MKVCPRCQTEQSLDQFGSRKDGSYKSWCKSCSTAYQRNYYAKHRDQCQDSIKRSKQRRTDHARQLLASYLATSVCADCGECDPVVLDFDHVRGTKVAGVCELAGWGRSWAIIQKEIDKCEVVCLNCHRRRTARQQGWTPWRTRSSV